MPKRRRPIGVTPRPRSGAEAESARLQRCRDGREELLRVQGQGQQPGGASPPPRLVAVQAQEGLEELSHVEGQEGRQ